MQDTEKHHPDPFREGLAVQLGECRQQVAHTVSPSCRGPSHLGPHPSGAAVFSGARPSYFSSTWDGWCWLPGSPPGWPRLCGASVTILVFPLPSAAFSRSFRKHLVLHHLSQHLLWETPVCNSVEACRGMCVRGGWGRGIQRYSTALARKMLIIGHEGRNRGSSAETPICR